MTTISSTIPIPVGHADSLYRPTFYRTTLPEEREKLLAFRYRRPDIQVFDTIYEQLFELITIENAHTKLSQDAADKLISDRLGANNTDDYGIWVYYPWSRRLVHLLDNVEFGKVRTSRNCYKITPEEQAALFAKKVGIIGLTAGSAMALALAIERSVGELRLADYDSVELSDLNRIQTSTHNIGLNKSIMAARAIAEMDPFIDVRTFRGGISEKNVDDFLVDGGKIDLLIDACSGLDVKIFSRHKARHFRIPVLMATHDRGILDMERYDQEPDRPILHGLLKNTDINSVRNLSAKEKIPFVMGMIGEEHLSARLNASLLEVEQTIPSWPQLGSAVMLGSAIGAETCRKVLLEQQVASGRYQVDTDTIITSKRMYATTKDQHAYHASDRTYNFNEFIKTVNQFDFNSIRGSVRLENIQIRTLCDAAQLAPSLGNSQPAKWIIRDSVFFLFYDLERSRNWLDAGNASLHIALGCAIENIVVRALKMNLETVITYFPSGRESLLAASLFFRKIETDAGHHRFRDLAKYIYVRNTNRNQGERHVLPDSIYNAFSEVVSSFPGCNAEIITKEQDLERLAEILSACDRIRLLTEESHAEFYKKIRWTSEQAFETGDGIEVELLDLAVEDLAEFRLSREWKSMELTRDWNKGRSIQKTTRNSIRSASAVALITIPSEGHDLAMEAGRCIERSWLYATGLGLAVQPFYPVIPLLDRVRTNNLQEFAPEIREEIKRICNEFQELFESGSARKPIFLLKLSIADQVHKKSARLPFDRVFHTATIHS